MHGWMVVVMKRSLRHISTWVHTQRARIIIIIIAAWWPGELRTALGGAIQLDTGRLLPIPC